MKRIKHQLKIKLCSQAGESIGETLVALLVSALALVMLAGAIASGTNVITRSRDTLDSYYNKAEDIIQRPASTSTASITITDSNNMISAPTYTVTYYENSTFPNTPVISYKIKP